MKKCITRDGSGLFIYLDYDDERYLGPAAPEGMDYREERKWVRENCRPLAEGQYPQLDMEELFEKHDEEFLKFERVELKSSQRADLHAFILLDRLCPGHPDIVAGAEHDEIYLAPDVEELAQVATEEEVVELIRCGVRLGDGGLCMFA